MTVNGDNLKEKQLEEKVGRLEDRIEKLKEKVSREATGNISLRNYCNDLEKDISFLRKEHVERHEWLDIMNKQEGDKTKQIKELKDAIVKMTLAKF